MQKILDITNAIEQVAPLSLQEEWDNSGWQVGPLKDEVSAALLCVDVTPQVIDEAISKNCDLIISHHPLIFSGIKTLDYKDVTSAIIIKAVQHNISIYSSHTAMDAAFNGVNGKICEKLNLKNYHILDNPDAQSGIGMIGFTDKPYSEIEFLEKVKKTFGCQSIKHSDLTGRTVNKVAVCGGSGAYLINNAMEQGADIFVTADVKYHQYFNALGKMVVADIGHFESEQFTKDIFYCIITKKFPKFAVHFSELGKSPINTL